MSFIPYGRQSITQQDVQAVVDVLTGDDLTTGPTVTAFEQAVAEYCGAQHAIAVANCTAALHIACLALEVGPGDSVWTSPNTFLASANCARYCGAAVDFVDTDPQTYNLCAKQLKSKLESVASAGTLPKVIIPVHFAGQSCEMREIKTLADQYGVAVIEDAAHAIGGEYLGEKVGSCQYSDMAVFSFHPVKTLTTGEGGMLLTNNPELAEKLRLLRCHGMTRDLEQMQTTQAPEPWFYEQITLGYNYRITDIQCALGLTQLTRLDDFISARRAQVAHYNQALADLPLTTPYQHGDSNPGWHLYVITVAPKQRRALFDALRNAQIGANVHYIPVHTQPYYQDLGFAWGDFPQAEAYYQGAITLPLFPAMTRAQQDKVVAVIQAFFSAQSVGSQQIAAQTTT